ncbi:zinc finger protein 366 [Carlito syrichta]|uniref:Zinc finger protein 366 n=1 Tax=Carlito syrichta TaxID=1868482 RepID=A0A3Q0DWI5_CARSF|nr:zinc finger protein 366 [Carlito syrichta]
MRKEEGNSRGLRCCVPALKHPSNAVSRNFIPGTGASVSSVPRAALGRGHALLVDFCDRKKNEAWTPRKACCLSTTAFLTLASPQGVKEHKCGICGREFTLLANMKRHVLIHTNIRAYQCHLCYKSFVQKQTLKAHMIVHSDVKPFKCKLCGKEFNRMHNLMGHMHLHSDSKPFKCLYCPSKFTLKGNLTRHMKVKHGVMERGLHSQGLGRGRMALTQTGILRSLEQEEPFDLSQKRRANGPGFQSDGESARGSPCHEEEDEDNCCEVEPCSPSPAPQNQPLCAPQDLSAKPEQAPGVLGEACKEEEEEHMSKGEWAERRKGDLGAEGGQERGCAGRDERLSLRALQSSRRGPSFSDYLYFKHRDGSLKELLEGKMEKQAVLLGI